LRWSSNYRKSKKAPKIGGSHSRPLHLFTARLFL
jgi:hypothetical protein